jgi:hypothetical protein
LRTKSSTSAAVSDSEMSLSRQDVNLVRPPVLRPWRGVHDRMAASSISIFCHSTRVGALPMTGTGS